jgi:hypothetical protein
LVRWARHAECVGGEEQWIQWFGGKATKKETTGKDNIKMDFREIRWYDLD